MKRTLIVGLWSLVAYGAMYLASIIFWWAYPYPDNATQDQIYTVWSTHVLTEKYFSYVLTAILAAGTTLWLKKSLGKISIICGILAGISFHAIGGGIYVARFGIEPYITNSKPAMLLAIVLGLTACVAIATHMGMPNKSKHSEL